MTRSIIRTFHLCLFATLLLAACQTTSPFQGLQTTPVGQQADQSTTDAAPTAPAPTVAAETGETPQTQVEATPAHEATAPATPAPAAPELVLQTRTSGSDASAASIFAALSPAIAFVETEAGTGSGALIDGGYLLSNAHVVWPYTAVRVVFPDGSEHLDVPVVGWDLTADLALVGPIETDITPVPLVDGGDVEVGSDVYLIGYPAEVETFPQPTITNGILSRVRTWESIDYTFFQVDATITNGQSGGVMVTQDGDVAGISTFYYSGFGLAGSVADALPRLNAILGHERDVVLGDRRFVDGEGDTRFVATLLDEDDTDRFILWQPEGTEVELRVEGVGRPQIRVSALHGYQMEFSESTDPEAKEVTLSFTTENAPPYVVEVYQPSENENEYVLTSSHSLTPYEDLDDRRVLAVGETVMGIMDVPTDQDVFELTLAEGDRIEIVVDALGVDPRIDLRYETRTRQELVSDDDSGGGIFGESSKLVYQAPETGTYHLFVNSYSFDSVGSYFVRVSEADADAELTEPEISLILMPTGYGKLSWYESEKYDFQVLRPNDWEELPVYQCAPGSVACYTNGAVLMLLSEESIVEMPRRERNRQGYVDLVVDILSDQPGITLQTREPVTTLQGLEATRLDFTGQAGRVRVTRLIYVDEKAPAAFSITFAGQSETFEQMGPVIDFFFDSFRVWEDGEREESPVFHLDEGFRLQAAREKEAALEAYSRSIEMDPELAAAYERRGSVHWSMGQMDEALADLSRAIELEPEKTDLLSTRSMIHWENGDLEAAMADLERAIELNPDRANYYNQRALVRAEAGEYEEALADIETTVDLTGGELAPNFRDSRAFIYLTMGELEKAREDYEAILDRDLRFPHALLGAGIVYGRLGDEERAAALVAEALADLEEEDLEQVDPQMARLLEMAEPFRSDGDGGE